MSALPGFIKPDNDRQVFFYEQDFYVLSNFSAYGQKYLLLLERQQQLKGAVI